MIRCIRLWTGDDDNSYFEEGVIDLPKGERGDILSGAFDVVSISFRETRAGGAFEWLARDADACRRTRADAATVLKVENI
jgi:predicted RecA/RadA family phage recombinase